MSKVERILRKSFLKSTISHLEAIQYDINNGNNFVVINDPNQAVLLLLNNNGYDFKRSTVHAYILKVDEKLKKQNHIRGTIDQLKRILKTIEYGKHIYNDNFTTTRLSKDVRNMLEEIGYAVEGENWMDYVANKGVGDFITKIRYRVYLNG